MKCPNCELNISCNKWEIVDCPRCKMPQIPEDFSSVVDELIAEKGIENRLGRFKICRQLSPVRDNESEPNRRYDLLEDNDAVKRVLALSLPTPSEQADHFIRLLAESKEKDYFQGIYFWNWSHLIGAFTRDSYYEILRDVVKRGLVSLKDGVGNILGPDTPGRSQRGLLTIEGWRYYEKLLKGKTSGNRGFMAMQFNNDILRQTILEENFKPAAKQAGFELATLDDDHIAGLIDNRLLVAIRASAFVVADISDNNRGVYFEAGFAMGLGKQVIFTCEHDKWEDRTVHFDIAHHYTIFWDSEKPEEAAKKLKSTIRQTLPDIAKMSDEDE